MVKGKPVTKDEAPRPSLPTDHAFVVQFRARSRGHRLATGGRVEHLRSGEAIHFESPAELLAFARRVLGRASRGASAGQCFDTTESAPTVAARANHDVDQRTGKPRA